MYLFRLTLTKTHITDGVAPCGLTFVVNWNFVIENNQVMDQYNDSYTVILLMIGSSG